MDGDAKINFSEFQSGMKSGLTVFSGAGSRSQEKRKRPQSGAQISRRKQSAIPTVKRIIFKEPSFEALLSPRRSTPKKCPRKASNRMRDTEL